MERLKAAWPFGQKLPSSTSKHNAHASPKCLTRTLGNSAISNLFCVLVHQPNLRPHSARQATQPFAPFPTLPELLNFASPPAEPEDFLWIKNKMEPMAGIEPATDGLRNRCSTAELHWLKTIEKSAFYAVILATQRRIFWARSSQWQVNSSLVS